MQELLYIQLKLKITNVIEYMKQSKKMFPYDYRYIILKEDNLNNNLINYVLESYTDQELDLLFSILEENVENDEMFNEVNTKKVLEKCNKEYNKRF